jgi:hypothetical protein
MNKDEQTLAQRMLSAFSPEEQNLLSIADDELESAIKEQAKVRDRGKRAKK